MLLANLIFVVSHLKIHPAIHLNSSKVLTWLYQKEKFIKSLLAFAIPMFQHMLKKYKIIAERLDVQMEQARILI